MGFRISKVYTRSGDSGSTGLATGQRVAKHHPLIQALGAVDELNAQLGVLKAELEGPEAAVLRASLEQIQQQLFNLGGDLALPGGCLLRAQAVEWLETQIDDWNRSLPPLQNFILPGGSRANAQAHLARAVARRAERQVVALTETPGPDGHVLAVGRVRGKEDPDHSPPVINEQVLVYLNRLSDWLFVLARVLDESPEVLWQQPGR